MIQRRSERKRETMKGVLLSSSCLVLFLGVAAVLAAPIGRQPFRGSRRRIETKEEMKSYLTQYGWVGGSGRRDSGTEDELQSDLRRFQKYFNLPVTGKADNETLDLMATPRCGIPDTNATSSRRKRYVLYDTKWQTTTLPYFIQNFLPNLTESSQRSAFQRAFQDWSDVLPSLSFPEVKTASAAKLRLGFARGDHGDGSSFDGRGGTLAHAFFPRVGLAHFDSDEQWTADLLCSIFTNLRQVAMHEIGHLLGLQHSTFRNAIMYPYYYCRSKPALDKDDILGIQALYGAPRTTLSSSSSSSAPSSSSFTDRPTTMRTAGSTARASTPKTTIMTRRPCRSWWRC